MSTPAHWAYVARACARRAYRVRATSRRGLMLVEGDGVLVFYDNHPPAGSMRLRERVTARFRAILDEAGIGVLAEATYPRRGRDDGRTLAVVLDAGEGDEDDVTEAWDRACRETPPEAGDD